MNRKRAKPAKKTLRSDYVRTVSKGRPRRQRAAPLKREHSRGGLWRALAGALRRALALLRALAPARVRAWAAHHAEAIKDNARRHLLSFATLSQWLLIGIALTLPAALYMGIENLRALDPSWQAPNHISLFVADGADPAALAKRLTARADVEQVEIISKEQSLKEFRETSGLAEIIDSLPQNPLPASLVVRSVHERSERAQMDALRAELAAQPGVERATLDDLWISRLYQLLELGERLLALFSALMAGGLLLVIGNTVRAEVGARREEIELLRLLGASKAYTRRPLLYLGLLHGVGGGLSACALLALTRLWLEDPAAELAKLYSTDFALGGLGLARGSALVAASGTLGVIGAWGAARRHLRAHG